LRVRAAVALAVAAALLAACAGEDAAAPTTAPSPSASPGEAVPYDTLEEIAAAFGCEDLQDVGTGGNPGLEAFGVCHLGRANVDIYLTSARSAWEHIAEQFPSVLGPNYIVVCPTGAKVARKVHARLGGELKIPGA
jgi:hypothetical protein